MGAMTCREFNEFLVEYFSRTITDAERARFEAHIAECTWCEDYLRSYRETIKLGKAAFADLDAELPRDVPTELVRAILAARPRRA